MVGRARRHRRVLTRIVCWWSTFTIATASVWSYASVLAIRFLFGAGEAGAWPNAARTFSRWIPLTSAGACRASSSPAHFSPAA